MTIYFKTQTIAIMKKQVFYVWASDKCLTGWGPAIGKIVKHIVICDNWDEAKKILHGFNESEEFKHVNWGFKKPYFSPQKYIVSFRAAQEWTRFN